MFVLGTLPSAVHIIRTCVTALQSQAQSTSKDASEAPADAQADTETERLRNQFNFNDRASQVIKVHFPTDHPMDSTPQSLPISAKGYSCEQDMLWML